MRGRALLVVTLGLLVVACSSAGSETTSTSAPTTTTSSAAVGSTTTAPSSTTTSTTTTTTAPAPAGYSAVDGLPVYDPTLLDRRVLMVKIDNSAPAQPQSGIQAADAIVELVVVPGDTRLIAMFHHSDADYLGPLRSLRPSDVEIAAVLDGTMVYSGGQPWITALARERDIPRVAYDPSIMYRISGRELPHNLYGSTLGFRAFANDAGLPDEAPTPWLPFGDPPLPQTAATDVTLTWKHGVPDVRWRFDPGTGTYQRTVGGEFRDWVDEAGERGHIDAEVLIVISGRFYTAYAPADAPGSHTPVPAIHTVGSGRAWVFFDGVGWEGTWRRDTEREPFSFVGSDGIPVTVPPGRLWVSLLPTELVAYE